MGKVKYSIKTTDGNRFEFEREKGEVALSYKPNPVTPEWIVVTEQSTTRYFYMKNIVSITKRYEEET